MLNNVLIYNPKCSKSRKALEILEGKGIEFSKREYLESPLTKEELGEVLSVLGKEISDIVRVKEQDYIENNLSSVTPDELIDAVVRFPIILERPIVILSGKGVVARPPENIEDLF
ncbi:arsenate reductase (glutaredoxin) [bacterium]|nr:arsenate reductase (glutaredoxin) [bacterium]